MSKYVKELQMKDFRQSFTDVDDVLVVNVVGIPAVDDNHMRLELRKKGIQLRAVKNSLARKVFEELGLAPANPYLYGSSAIVWGGPGIVELAKEITEWAKKLQSFTVKGGCVSGQGLDAQGVEQLSKMPTREELLGQVVGMLLGPASTVVAQLTGPASQVASQIEKLAEKEASAEE